MAYNEFILEPLNGVDEFINTPDWTEYGPGLVLPMVGIPVTIRVNFPFDLPTGQGSAQVYIREYASVDDPPAAYGQNMLCQLHPDFNWAVPPIELEVEALPSLPNLRFYFYQPTVSLNWGQVLGKVSYSDVINAAAYKHIIEGRGKLERVLARVSKQKTQLQGKLTQSEAEELEAQEAMVLYTNFLSNDIALFEVLNP